MHYYRIGITRTKLADCLTRIIPCYRAKLAYSVIITQAAPSSAPINSAFV